MSSNPYSSVFASLCNEFIAQKRAIGYRYITEDRDLKYFDGFIQSMGLKELILSRELVEAWVEKRPCEAAKSREHRITIAREFARFVAVKGYAAYIFPPQKKQTNVNFTPYIFTNEEISKIMYEADHMEKKSVSPYIHLIIPVLFRVLYGCGLRISEALSLRVQDVDTQHRHFTILDSKYGDSRIVPMSKTLHERCVTFMGSIPSHVYPDSPFFPSRAGGTMGTRGVYAQYRQLLWQAGISHGGRGNGPRLHDLRHTFAVHSMRQLIAAGVDVTITSPILSTYLGHRSLASTEQYLRLSAEGHPDVMQKIEKYFSAVIPGRTL